MADIRDRTDTDTEVSLASLRLSNSGPLSSNNTAPVSSPTPSSETPQSTKGEQFPVVKVTFADGPKTRYFEPTWPPKRLSEKPTSGRDDHDNGNADSPDKNNTCRVCVEAAPKPIVSDPKTDGDSTKNVSDSCLATRARLIGNTMLRHVRSRSQQRLGDLRVQSGRSLLQSPTAPVVASISRREQKNPSSTTC